MNRYKSDIYEAIHQDALADFEVGTITEARMREYDEMCLLPNTSQENTSHETVKIDHADLVTA
jgi:DNA-binding transcriptional regulator YiaG